MRKVLGLVGATLLLGGPAFAADLGNPVYKAPALMPVFSWTGLYIGGHVGGAEFNKDWFFPDVGTSTSHTATSFLGGGQIGYNYQLGSWVFGIQGDASWFSSLKGASVCPNPRAQCGTEEKWIASATGRVGYALDRILVYAKGGGAWTHDDYSVSFPAAPISNEVNSGGGNRTGWTVGGGLEYAFWNNWSAFVEYDHFDFGTANFSMVRAATGTFVEHLNVGQRVDEVKVGVNYRF